MVRQVSDTTIRAILLCERHEGLTYKQLQELLPDCSNANKYARSACSLGLMRHDSGFPRKYFAVDGWRSSPLIPAEIEPKNQHLEVPKMINFAFNVGCLAGFNGLEKA